VTVTQRAEEAKLPLAYAPPQRTASILPGDRVGLTRELQRELKRVGCYDGDVNGVWTPASRRAMKAFTDRVNASLPIDEPDYILLTLVQGRQDRACGAPCPTGQVMADSGRCLPSAVVAQQTGKKTQPAHTVAKAPEPTPGPATSGWMTTVTAVAPKLPEVPEGRMALAGPKKETPVEATIESGASKVVNGAERPVKRRVVDKNSRRYVTAPRKRFGPSFFRQQYTWNY
jgi:hypothetical protein